MLYLSNKEYFKKYRSNTIGASGNQHMLIFDKETQITAKMFFKIKKYGKFNYRLFFSNLTDSTFSDGSVSKANMSGDEYFIKEAYIGVTLGFYADLEPEIRIPVTFDKKTEKKVGKGETYWSDEFELEINEGQILLFEWTVKGTKFPYSPERVLSSFIKKDDGTYIESPDSPHPNLIGCDFGFEKNIAFLGDSITMGCGTTKNAYHNWASYISDYLGENFSVWNIGLGYARAQDAATDGVWLEKAKQYDTINICLGVNDLLQGRSAQELKNDLTKIVEILKNENKNVGIFTVPTFDWEGKNQKAWDEVNDYIRNVLSKKVDYVFDMAHHTSQGGENKYKSLYGGHPNDFGCEIIAREFIKAIKL